MNSWIPVLFNGSQFVTIILGQIVQNLANGSFFYLAPVFSPFFNCGKKNYEDIYIYNI